MKKYLNSHLRWLVVFYLVIAAAEERVLRIPTVNLFDIMFEILSAYGTSGLSMGAPGKPYSLCGEFNNVSKARPPRRRCRRAGRERGRKPPSPPNVPGRALCFTPAAVIDALSRPRSPLTPRCRRRRPIYLPPTPTRSYCAS